MQNQQLQNTLFQILMWSGLWLLMLFLMTMGHSTFTGLLLRSMSSLLIIAVTIALNIHVLLPRFFFRNRKLLFVLLGILLFFALGMLVHFELLPWQADMERVRQPRRRMGEFLRLLSILPAFLLAFLGSTVLEISKYAQEKEKEAVQLTKEKLESELKFLKSQINPHFLFNALNNIYTLTVIKHDKAPENLLRLSDMLRYMVYDSNAEKVPLEKEIKYLEDFVELSKLKGKMNVKLELVQVDIHREVPPLLFVSFVENAFKHGNIEDEEGWIRIRLSTTTEEVQFTCENSIAARPQPKDKSGGIGLDNVRKRLNLLYPNRHSLNILRDSTQFSVYLNIKT